MGGGKTVHPVSRVYTSARIRAYGPSSKQVRPRYGSSAAPSSTKARPTFAAAPVGTTLQLKPLTILGLNSRVPQSRMPTRPTRGEAPLSPGTPRAAARVRPRTTARDEELARVGAGRPRPHCQRTRVGAPSGFFTSFTGDRESASLSVLG